MKDFQFEFSGRAWVEAESEKEAKELLVERLSDCIRRDGDIFAYLVKITKC